RRVWEAKFYGPRRSTVEFRACSKSNHRVRMPCRRAAGPTPRRAPPPGGGRPPPGTTNAPAPSGSPPPARGAGRAGAGQSRAKRGARGMPIRGIRRYAELVAAGPGNEQERLALLDAHRAEVLAKMAELQENQAIDHKIEVYRGSIAAGEADRLWAPVYPLP